jgi:hypothetical protein
MPHIPPFDTSACVTYQRGVHPIKINTAPAIMIPMRHPRFMPAMAWGGKADKFFLLYKIFTEIGDLPHRSS